MHGVGRMEWPDGGHYDGQFRDGAFDGKGTFTYQNGDIYEGDWEADVRHGEGKYYSAKNGQTRVSSWSNDIE
jgi:hypothetical protein